MGFNLVTNLNSCYLAIQENSSLLYYSHIPTVIVALVISFFVFWGNRKYLPSKILLFISVMFALWSFSDLGLWTSSSSVSITLLWSFINLLEMLVSVSTLYFAYTFLEEKDVALRFKLLVGVLLGIFIIFIPTKFNLTGFNYDNCEAGQGLLINYYHMLEVFFSLWIIIYLARKIWTAEKGDKRKKTIYLSLGIVFFMLSFSGTNVYSSITTHWEVLQYGLFGMVVFMGFLGYLIVKFKAFNVRLIGAQALVFSLIILIGSQFAFIQNNVNRVLTGITLMATLFFGYFLVKSVKKEIEQKEQLEIANGELLQRKNELQYISDKLAESNDKLRILDNAKTEFISIASHQLRTPPTAIKGYASMLVEGSFGLINEKQQGALKKIINANDQQIHFVEDLLNVSRIESGRMEYDIKEVDAEELCQNAVDNLFFKAKDNGLYLDYKKSENALPKIAVDGPKVLEVISNMIDNALKYTPKGGVSVRAILCEKNDKSCMTEKHVRITISDTGIGIPATELPYLFAKFSRGKDISRLNTGGIGLGLYVGKIMIEANGGKIWAESEGAGRGSHFIIELPVKQAEKEMGNVG